MNKGVILLLKYNTINITIIILIITYYLKVKQILNII